MTSWPALETEIDRWADDGRTATFWWRDDDATHPTPELDRLLRIAGETAAPIALAVIPGGAGATLADRVLSEDRVDILQHGYAHRNHEPEGKPKSEFGPARPPKDAIRELAEGRRRLSHLFGDKAQPVLVPPWNRIDPQFIEFLTDTGLRGLSTFKPRSSLSATDRPIRVNTHVDIIDWRSSRGFCGEDEVLSAIIDHLEKRRNGTVDSEEPTGILSHHLDHDQGCAAFLARLAAFIASHRGADWIRARELFDV